MWTAVTWQDISAPTILARRRLMRTFIRCTLSTLEHEEEIDERWEGEDQQRLLKPSPSTLADRCTRWHERDTRKAHSEGDGREVMNVPR